MRFDPTTTRRIAAVALAGWILAAAPAAAQVAPLGEIELPAAPVSLVLDDARVTITAGNGASPLLRWWRDRADDPGAAELAAFSDGGTVVVQRPAATEGEPRARLRVELVVDAAQPLAVAGAGLDLELERAGVEAAERLDVAPPAAPPVAAAATQLNLVDSQVQIGGLGGIVGVFDGGAVELRGTAGSHDLTVRDGSLRMLGHQGGATLNGDGADLAVEDAGGQLTIRAAGGTTSLRSVRGRFQIELVDAGLQILDGGGTGLIVVTDSSADLRGARFQAVNLKSVMSHVTASACDGSTTIDLTGGSLAFDGGSGSLTGAARDGAVVELGDHRGDVQLNLEEGSSAELRAVDGKVKLRARGGEVVVDRASSLDVELDGVFATIGGVTALGPFKVVSSRVELDLSELGRPAVELAVQADSTVRVRLATPCRVRATGLDSSLASQVDVTGCELQLGAGGRWATRRVRDIEGRPPTTLTAQIAESSELTVEGRP